MRLSVVALFLMSVTVVQAGLIHHYTLDETVTTASAIIDDSAPGNKDGTVAGTGVTSQPGKVGTALHFDGTASSHVQILNFDTTNLKDVTLAFWMNITPGTIAGLASTQILRIVSGADGWEAIIQADTTADKGKLGNNLYRTGGKYAPTLLTGYPLSDNVMPEGEWVHIAITSSLLASNGGNPGGDGYMRIYVNGALQQQQLPNAIDNWAGGTLMFAHRPSAAANQHFKGLLDDIRIYNEVLTQEQIQALPGLVPEPSTLVLTVLGLLGLLASWGWRRKR